MTPGFTKLFSSIIHSSIWNESNETRIVWVTMLAMADCDGHVAASLPGLAHAARVSMEQCREAVRVLESPDPYSRTPAEDGIRIKPEPGGWLVINYRHYRELGRQTDRREYKAAKQREYRQETPAPVQAREEHDDQPVQLPHGFPKSEDEAKRHAGFVGCPEEFAATTYHAAVARGGRDAKDIPIRSFRSHLSAMWSYQKAREAERTPATKEQQQHASKSLAQRDAERALAKLGVAA